MTASTETRKFETKTCSRCGGSGQYSYCQMYGSTCFKCSGSGKMYTARGLAARAFLIASRTIKAGDVKLGDRIKSSGTTITVQSCYTQLRSGSHTKDGVTVFCNHLYLNGTKYSLGLFADTDVELILPTAAQRNAQIIAALDFQDTLTVAGKPRKR